MFTLGIVCPGTLTSDCRRVAQPCRRRGDGQLSCRAAQGCSTARQPTKKGNPRGRLCAVHAPTHAPFRGGWRLPDPHTPSGTACPLPLLAPSSFILFSFSLEPPIPSPSSSPASLSARCIHNPTLGPSFQHSSSPRDKGASATLRADSGRLASRIGRSFETASRVDIALVTNEKVGSADVNASTGYAYDRPVYHGEKISV